MGRKDLQVLFAMAIGCTTHDLPDHQDTPFSKAKMYHSEVKPDAATLKLEVTRQWKAYFFTCHQPHPSNWKIDKCTDYLMSHPILTLEATDLDFLESELKEWTGIQEMINESNEKEEDQIINHSWIFLTSIYITPWWMTLSGVPSGKHTVQKHMTNWMEGTLPYFKTFMN